MNREKTSPLGYYTIGIAALFLLGFLLLIIFGAQVYRDAVTGQNQNDQTRALRSYLVTCTRTASAEDVEVTDFDGSEMLVIRESGTDYGLRIFLHDGQLVEHYGLLDQEPDPEYATRIARTDLFDVEKISRNTFSVTTDSGRALLHVGSAAADEPADEGGDGR